MFDFNGNGLCDPDEVFGCLYPFAQNYNPEATTDNGSCVFPEGCAEETACGLVYDGNNDGVVGSGDLLQLLTEFGQTCTPLFACGAPVAYQGYEYATVLIGDQCWFAENLRNENYRNGEAIPAGLSDSSWVFTSFGAVAVFGEGTSACAHSSPDGNACDELWSLNEFGRLYNWYSVVDARGLCPNGWHAPSDSEWMMMEMALGMSEELVTEEGFRGSQGNDMKSDFGWSLNDGFNGSNTSGFSGFSGGLRAQSTGQFSNVGTEGYWWSTTINQSQAWVRGLETWSNRVIRQDLDPRLGLSVRCVQNEATCLLDEDEDGICDSLDDCIGEIDACGVCNGLGAIYDCGCTDIPEGNCDCEGNSDADEDGICDYLDDCVGDLDEEGACNCGDLVFYQGHEYATVYIGGRCWFAENLRSENYANGEPIPANLSSSGWTSTTSGAVAVYGEGDVSCSESSPSGDACDESWSLNAYGRLYNWYAVDDSRGICPNGWKVPSDEEWMHLTDYLGGEEIAGGAMTADFGWAYQFENPFFSTNASGFSGLPGGRRNGGGVNATFTLAGLGGLWWSSSAVGSNAWSRTMYFDTSNVYRHEKDRHDGYSIRCVKNAD